MNNLVSIIIPTYNREMKLIRAINSVLEQTYKNIEIIVVDDCSSDGTSALMEKYANDDRVTYYKLEKNVGACAARNKGIELSHGEYIGFLDSDDIFYQEKIESQMKCLMQTKCDLCAGSFIRIDDRGRKIVTRVQNLQGEALFSELLFCNFITTGTILGHRYCFEDIRFDETLPRYQDWDLVLRLAKKYTFCFVEAPLIEQEHLKESITASTGYDKTLKALIAIYSKFQSEYDNDQKAGCQMHWLIGHYSAFSKAKTRFRDLWIGVQANGFSIRRFLIFLYIVIFKR